MRGTRPRRTLACGQVARITTVPETDGRWPQLRLPELCAVAYAPRVNDRQYFFVILTLSALSVMLLSVALFSG